MNTKSFSASAIHLRVRRVRRICAKLSDAVLRTPGADRPQTVVVRLDEFELGTLIETIEQEMMYLERAAHAADVRLGFPSDHVICPLIVEAARTSRAICAIGNLVLPSTGYDDYELARLVDKLEHRLEALERAASAMRLPRRRKRVASPPGASSARHGCASGDFNG